MGKNDKQPKDRTIISPPKDLRDEDKNFFNLKGSLDYYEMVDIVLQMRGTYCLASTHRCANLFEHKLCSDCPVTLVIGHVSLLQYETWMRNRKMEESS